MIKDSKTEKIEIEKKESKKNYIFAVGRRKEAVARVRLYQQDKDGLTWGDQEVKKGDIFVNTMPGGQYFSPHGYIQLTEPLKVTNSLSRFAFTIQVNGGGKKGQLIAAIHGLARALDKVDKEKFHATLRKKGFLTRDARIRQRRKIGMGGKSRRKRQSPKR